MSPNAVNDVANSFVEMAKAYEQLPYIEENLRLAHARLEEQRQHIAGLETNIIGYKADIEGLNAHSHKLEAERDDAELRFLEAEEKLGTYTKVVRDLAAGLGMVDKPEPAPTVIEPEPVQATDYSFHEPMPIGDMQGQSEADPMPVSIADTSSTAEGTGAAPNVDTHGAAPEMLPVIDEDKPFLGKTWSEAHNERFSFSQHWQNAIYNRHGWVQGGGTEEGWNAS